MWKKLLGSLAASVAMVTGAAPGDISSLYGFGMGDGLPATSLRINPYAIAVGPGGNVFFTTDSGYSVARVSGGVLTTIAGNFFLGPGGENVPGTSVGIGRTRGVATDSSGNVYFADADNGKIRRI